MCNHSSSDTDPQEEYSPLSVEEDYLPQSVEDHSPSSDDFDPQEESSPMSVEEYSPLSVEDSSPLADDFDPQEEYSPLSAEEYSPQSVEIYSPLSDEMSIEENTIEEYTPGTPEDDDSQRVQMDEAYIEGYRNFEKLLAEFIEKLEGHSMNLSSSLYDQLLSFGDLIVSEWPWSDGGLASIWKEVVHALLKVLPEELRRHNYVLLTLLEADILTTFNEALEIILDYDDHRVRKNLRKHAALTMGSSLKTQKRYDPKAGWYINHAYKNYLVGEKYYLPQDDEHSIYAHFERILYEIPDSFRITD